MLKYWLWLATRKGLGLQTIYTVARSFSDVEQAYRATPEQYKEFAGLSRSGSLSDKDLTEAERILRRCEQADIRIVTLLDAEYPKMLRTMPDAPIVLYYKGTLPDADRPAVAVIGSRDLYEGNRHFAEQAGYQIAKQGYVLVSGNARGADKTAQNACLEAGGQVISVVADSMQKQPLTRNVLWLSLDDFDQEFSAQRALRRNHIIHALAQLTIAAQCTLGKGGTWDGICSNLKNAWNPVCIFADGSDAAIELENRGVQTITADDLQNLVTLTCQNPSFIQE